MSFTRKIVYAVAFGILFGMMLVQRDQIKELRTDISRVSKVQVQCAGEIDYGPCIEQRLQEWANDHR